MKFIAFFEYNNEDVPVAVKTLMQLRASREKEPEKFAKLISENYSLGGELPNFTRDLRGFVLYEADNMDQLANISALYHLNIPSARVKFTPIVEGTKAVELFMKAKK